MLGCSSKEDTNNLNDLKIKEQPQNNGTRWRTSLLVLAKVGKIKEMQKIKSKPSLHDIAWMAKSISLQGVGKNTKIIYTLQRKY
jgi:hypothetical protein